MRTALFYNYLVEATLMGSLLIGLLLLVRWLFRRQLGSKLVYGAWLLVALRLLLPLSLPNPAMNELRPTVYQDTAVRPIASQLRVRLGNAAVDMGYATTGGDWRQMDENVFYRVYHSLDRGQLARVGLMVYGAGVVLTAGWMMLCNRRFRRRLERDSVGELGGQEQKNYLALCEARRVRPLTVILVDPLPGPCLVGAFKPVIALPPAMPKAARMAALTHEICHYKGRDHWWGLLRSICCAVHWFNPLVWLGARCSRLDGELTCDQRVADGLEYDQRLSYVKTLAGMALSPREPGMGVIATGMTMKGRHLKRRIRDVLARKQVRTAAIVVFTAAATVAVLWAFATAELRATPTVANRAAAINVVYNTQTDDQRAMRRDILDEAAAQAYFQRLLDSPYIQAWGDVSRPAEKTADGWRCVDENSDGTSISAQFNNEGVITAFQNTAAIRGALADSPTPYTMTPGDDSIYNYLKAFAYAYLPDITWDSMKIVADQYNGGGRYVTCETGNRYTERAHAFVVQVEPEPRVVSFALLDEESKTVERISQKMDGGGAADNVAAGDASPETAGAIALPIATPATSITPPDGAIDQQTAIAMARNALTEQYGVANPVEYSAQAAFTSSGREAWEGLGLEGQRDLPLWKVSFYPGETQIEPSYIVTLSPDGSVVCAGQPGTVPDYLEQLERERGMFVTWPYADKAAFSALWPYMAVAYGGYIDGMHAAMGYYHYGLPAQDAISEESAKTIALNAVIQTYKPDMALSAYTAYIIDDKDAPYWQIWFAINGFANRYTAKVSSDGQLLELIDRLAEGSTEPPAVTEPPAAVPAAGELDEEDVVAIAQKALMEVYGLSAHEVERMIVVDPAYHDDQDHNWYGYVPTSPYWWVGFRRPETDVAFYSDYSALIDAKTGEVLQLRDPGNIGNG